MTEKRHTIAVVNGTSRLAQAIVPQALGAGYQVKAIVRSAKRFSAVAGQHDQLSVHEIKDFNDVTAFRDVLHGVSTLYVAAAINSNVPTTVNQDIVQTTVAALQLESLANGTKISPTKIVLLSSHNVFSGKPSGGFPWNTILYYQFQDLIRTQVFLAKQSSWLKYTVVSAGGIVDVKETDVQTNEVKIQHGSPVHPDGLISYGRLAAACLMAGENSEGKWDGQYISAIPTSKVKFSITDLSTGGEVIWENVTRYLVPRLMEGAGLVLVGFAIGYWYNAPSNH